MRPGFVLTALGALVLGAAVLWLMPHVRWIDSVKDAGFTTQARHDPYLAARRFLDSAGVVQHRARGLSMFDRASTVPFPKTGDALFLFNGYGMLSPARGERLLAWVKGGGQLVMTGENPYIDFSLPRPDPVFDSFHVSPGLSDGAGKVRPAPAYPGYARPHCDGLRNQVNFKFAGDAHPVTVSIPGHHILKPAAGFRAATLNDALGLRFAQFTYGKGRVTLIASSGQWRNAYVGCLDNAYFLWQLTPARGDVWWLVNRRGPSLWRHLWRNMPLLILVLGLLVPAWLWFKSVRFGPIRDGSEWSTGSFRRHLLASGAFLWRRKQSQALLDPLRTAIMERAGRCEASFAALSDDEKIRALARLTGIDPARVKAALTEVPDKTERFTAIMTVLALIRNRLWNL